MWTRVKCQQIKWKKQNKKTQARKVKQVDIFLFLYETGIETAMWIVALTIKRKKVHTILFMFLCGIMNMTIGSLL